jgi:TatD DNase family protein
VLPVRDKHCSESASLAAAAALQAGGYGRGMLHCFSGHERLLAVGLELGWMVSFAGNLTYKSAENLRASARRVPLDRLLVETDSPYLAPVPHRGKTNSPAFVRETAAVLAEVIEATPAELEALVDANAERFFGFAAARAAA